MTPPGEKPAPLFVDRDVQVFEGEAARERLERTNDARFVDGDLGVVAVDDARWREAQAYERRTWMEIGLSAADDHNREYLQWFEDYAPLRGRHFERAIELGCGPFTNLRLILQVARARRVHLLDPLAEDYLRHPHCRYRGRRLGGALSGLRSLGRSWRGPLGGLGEAIDALRTGGLAGVPVEIEAVPIEGFRTGHRFDLVVMINVLEHCRDARAVFGKIEEILSPGGVLVFHDRLWAPDEIQRTISQLYDAGHPLRVGRDLAMEFVGRFRPILRTERKVVDVEEGIRLERTALSFIGSKPG